MAQGTSSAFRQIDIRENPGKRLPHDLRGNEIPYNGLLSYGDIEFPVLVTSISYGWSLVVTGMSQTRNRQVVYPKRGEQSDISVSFAFRSVQEYIDFVEFIGDYHRKCVSDGTVEFPFMRFTCDGVGSKGCDYLVMPSSVNLAIKNSMEQGPSINGMGFIVLRDMLDWWGPQRGASFRTSSEIVPVENRVTPNDIKREATGADSAYSRMSNMNRRTALSRRYDV